MPIVEIPSDDGIGWHHTINVLRAVALVFAAFDLLEFFWVIILAASHEGTGTGVYVLATVLLMLSLIASTAVLVLVPPAPGSNG